MPSPPPVKLPLFLGSPGAELYDLDYLSARNVRVCLQGHLPFMAAVNAVHETLKALRAGTPPASIKAVASPDLMKQVTRQADYSNGRRSFSTRACRAKLTKPATALIEARSRQHIARKSRYACAEYARTSRRR